MTKTRQPAPRTIADAELDQASGGLVTALLLPAVQASREAARSTAGFKGGVFVGAADADGDMDGSDFV